MRKILQKHQYSIIEVSFGLLFGLLFFPSGIKSIFILIFSLSIILLNFQRKFMFRARFFFLNSSVYLFIVVTLFYSNNLDYAFSKLQTMFSLILFPLLFSFLTNEEIRKFYRHTNKYLWVYVFSVFLFNLIPFVWFYLSNYSLSGIIHHFSYIIIVDIGKYSIHPIYMSMHCCLAIIFSLHLFQQLRNNSKKFFLIIINITLVLFMIIYARKGPILAFILSILAMSIFYKKINIKLSLVLLVGLIFLLFVVPKTRERFLELINIEKATDKASNSTNIRYSIYKNASQATLISPVFGFGIGDYNDVLFETYKKENEKSLIAQNYNSHNQYLSFILIGGWLLLLLFLSTQVINTWNCLKYKNYLPIILLLFFSVLMFTENILEREYGVIFFSFLINFFLLKNYISVDE